MSIRLWRDSCSIIWSRKPMPVEIRCCPVPSRSRTALIRVSLVLRSTLAWRTPVLLSCRWDTGSILARTGPRGKGGVSGGWGARRVASASEAPGDHRRDRSGKSDPEVPPAEGRRENGGPSRELPDERIAPIPQTNDDGNSLRAAQGGDDDWTS